MANYDFRAGVAVNVATVGDAGSGIDTEVAFAVDTVAVVASDIGMTQVVQVTDLNDLPTQVRAGANGAFAPFRATVPSVYLQFGNLAPQFHASDQMLNALPQALAAQAAAEAAKRAAEAVEAQGGISPHRYWDEVNQAWYWIDASGTKNLGRPPVPNGVVVTSHSKVYPNATTPPGSLHGDEWRPHVSRLQNAQVA